MFRNRQRAVPTYIVPDSTAACEIPPQTRTASPYSLYTVPTYVRTRGSSHQTDIVTHARRTMMAQCILPGLGCKEQGSPCRNLENPGGRERRAPLHTIPCPRSESPLPFEGIAIRPHCGILTPFRSSTQAAAGRAHRGRAHRGRSHRGPRLPLDACKACGTSPRQVRPLLPERSAPASPFTLLSGRPSPSGERATGERRGRWRSRSRGRPGSCRRRRPS